MHYTHKLSNCVALHRSQYYAHHLRMNDRIAERRSPIVPMKEDRSGLEMTCEDIVKKSEIEDDEEPRAIICHFNIGPNEKKTSAPQCRCQGNRIVGVSDLTS